MRSAESIAVSLTYIQHAPDLSPAAKQRLTNLVQVLDIEVTTISLAGQPVTFVVDYSKPLTEMDTPAHQWVVRSQQTEVA